MSWSDPETIKRFQEKQLGLLPDDGTKERISTLENRMSLLESQLNLAIKQREVIELKQTEMEKWAKKREQDFVEIERIAQELAEEERMKEDGR
jgi:hypothetical protein